MKFSKLKIGWIIFIISLIIFFIFAKSIIGENYIIKDKSLILIYTIFLVYIVLFFIVIYVMTYTTVVKKAKKIMYSDKKNITSVTKYYYYLIIFLPQSLFFILIVGILFYNVLIEQSFQVFFLVFILPFLLITSGIFFCLLKMHIFSGKQ